MAFDPVQWDNHLWSLTASVLTLYYLTINPIADPRSFTDLITSLDYGEASHKDIKPKEILFKCRNCSGEESVTIFEVKAREIEGKKREMSCSKCKVIKDGMSFGQFIRKV